jgi:hypothetical protein
VKEIFSLEKERKKGHSEEVVSLNVKVNHNNKKNNKCRSCDNNVEGNYKSCKTCYEKWQKELKEKREEEKEKKKNEKNVTNCNTEIKSNNWYLDSACTRHITNSVGDLCEIRKSLTEISGCTDEKSPATFEGTAILEYKDSKVYLYDVLCVPLVKRKLISVGLLVKQGCRVIFSNNKCEVSDQGKIIMTGKLDREDLFRVTAIKGNYRPSIVLNTENKPDKIKEWHERLGHASRSQLKYLVEQGIIKDFDLKELKNYTLGCVACEKGKMTRKSFSKRKDRYSTSVGDVIHSDVCGPITPIALGGYRYFVTFTDDYSRFTWVTPIKHKDEVLNLFKNLYNELKNQKGVKVKKLVSDGGGEYISKVFEAYLLKKGIESEVTPKNSPQMNGVAERLNRILMNIVRAMLKGKTLNNRLWAETLVCEQNY